MAVVVLLVVVMAEKWADRPWSHDAIAPTNAVQALSARNSEGLWGLRLLKLASF